MSDGCFFELEDEGRVELVRMAILKKDEIGRIDLRIVPGRLEDDRGFKHMIQMDIEGLFVWMIGYRM